MYFKTEGLILRETEYKDADKLLTVLTKDRGRLTLRARGVRSRNSKLKSGCQLLAYTEFTVVCCGSYAEGMRIFQCLCVCVGMLRMRSASSLIRCTVE